MEENKKRGKLYIVSTHIGNREDVTVRAIEVLKLADLVVCEELKIGSILLKDLKINKKLDTLNEQNESEKVFEYIKMIQEDDKKLALISDCGTPVFADPGYSLVRNALAADVNVIVVPGVTSLMTALVRSGLPLSQFLYAGFLSRKTEERTEELIALSKETRTVAIYDTPYRLLPLLEDASKIMPHRKVYIGMNLTMPYETHHYGTFIELFEKFKEARIKAEFVICFEGISDIELSKKSSFQKENPTRTNSFSDKSYSSRKVRINSSDRNRSKTRNDSYSSGRDRKFPPKPHSKRDSDRSNSFDRNKTRNMSNRRATGR
jgi:16S rRNA (cytidine1402-2'-O)-methyltransferase